MMNTLPIPKMFIWLCIVLFAMFSPDVFAAIDNQNVLDGVVEKYKDAATLWAVTIEERAKYIFWLLATLSLVVTFGFMIFQKADLATFFAEFIRFALFIGFFFWLLENGPAFADDIMKSLMQVGAEAGGVSGFSPSEIVDLGFEIIDAIISNISVWSPIDAAGALVVGFIILVVLALISINMLLLMVSAWILAYAGIFYLGFGGSKWTSDMAINYYKTVLGLGIQLFAMVLLIGVGKDIIVNYILAMSGEINLNELSVVLVVSITLLILVNKIPTMLAGIVNGSGAGSLGIGNFGAGAAVGAAAVAATAGAMAASGMASLATQTGGAGSAIAAAFKEAQQHMASGTGMFSGSSSSVSGSSNDSGSFSSAMSNPSSAIKSAATFAADMGANLARGMSSTAREGMANKMDDMKEAISQTVGGKVASEISNPGAAREERLDNKVIAAVQTLQQGAERREQAEEARAFMAGGDQSNSFSAGESGQSNNTQPVNDEVASFSGKNGEQPS